MATKMMAQVIYRAKRGHRYPGAGRQFACYKPAANAHGCRGVGDCWICDETGDIDPGFAASPMPVHVSALGEAVAVGVSG